MFSHPTRPQMEIESPVILERAMGIEPTYSAWKAAALPLCYARIFPIRKFWHYTSVLWTCQEGFTIPQFYLRPAANSIARLCQSLY